MKVRSTGLIGVLIVSCVVGLVWASGIGRAQAAEEAEGTRLCVVWTSGDPEVAHRVCLMYTHAAKTQEWFGTVKLVVWGPSSRLLAADKDVQAKIKEMMKDGVDVKACIVCADTYGVTPILRELGLEVKAMGAPLSQMLKDDWEVLTF